METTIMENQMEKMENEMDTREYMGLQYWGNIGIMENKMGTTIVYRGYIGIMDNKMETTIVCRGYIGIMETQWKLLWYIEVI